MTGLQGLAEPIRSGYYHVIPFEKPIGRTNIFIKNHWWVVRKPDAI